jgi:hypothetical protein
MARVKDLLILIRPTEASKCPVKEAPNDFLSCCIRCKSLSVLLNTFVHKDRVPLYNTTEALCQKGNRIIENNRDLSMRSPKLFLHRTDTRGKGKAVEDYTKYSNRIDIVAGPENNKVEA